MFLTDSIFFYLLHSCSSVCFFRSAKYLCCDSKCLSMFSGCISFIIFSAWDLTYFCIFFYYSYCLIFAVTKSSFSVFWVAVLVFLLLMTIAFSFWFSMILVLSLCFMSLTTFCWDPDFFSLLSDKGWGLLSAVFLVLSPLVELVVLWLCLSDLRAGACLFGYGLD